MWGPSGAARPGFPGHRSAWAPLSLGTGIPAAARKAAGHRDFAAASEGCSGVTSGSGGGERDGKFRGFPVLAIAEEAAAAKWSKWLQDASLSRGSLGGGGGTPGHPPVPRLPAAAVACETHGCFVSWSLCVYLRPGGRISANPEVSRKGSLRPRGRFGHARPVAHGDLLAPGRARSRVGQARLPGLHLLHTAFHLTPLRSPFSPSPYLFLPSITKRGWIQTTASRGRGGCSPAVQCRTSGVAVPVPPPAPGSGAQDPSQIADDVSPTLPSLSPPSQPPAYDIIKGDDHYLNGRTGSQAERPTSRRMTLSNISRVLAQDSARSPRFFPRRPPQGSARSGQARAPRRSAYCYETLSSCRHANAHKGRETSGKLHNARCFPTRRSPVKGD